MLPGSTVGRYRIASTCGAGNMGVVFAAYDVELGRKVALKLLNADGRGPDRRGVRLRREAQALARLEHPNVVAIHDVGEHHGQVFLSMEFIEGQTLREWARRERRSWREVLRVYVQAGRGLAAVHAVGLVHRDFKPDNAMIGVDGRVRVMDFGLARAHDEHEPVLDELVQRPAEGSALATPLTRTGSLLGTPAYMAPEQYMLQTASERSDQFNFCVSLYEGLYGERPFAGDTVDELVRHITLGERRAPPRMSPVPRRVRKILLRGLASGPSERWPSMTSLVDALARAPARRGRVALALAGALGTSVAALGGARLLEPDSCADAAAPGAAMLGHARREQLREAFEATELSYASASWTRAQAQLDAYLREWGSMRRGTCEAARKGELSAALLDARMLCLDRRLGQVGAVVELLAAGEPSVIGRAADMIARLPRLERCANAEALMAALPPPEEPALAAEVAALRQELAEVDALDAAGAYAQARARALALAREAEVLDYPPARVWAWQRLGAVQRALGEHDDARATFERSYDAALALGMKEEAAGAALELMFIFGLALHQHEQAMQWARFAKPLVRATRSPLAQARYLSSLGSLLSAEGRYDEAREHHERAIEMFEDELGPDHVRLVGPFENLGAVAHAQGRFEQARDHQARALAINETTRGPEHPEVARSLANLSGTLLRLGEVEQAREGYARALAIAEQNLEPDHPLIASVLLNLGSVAFVSKDFALARSSFERVVQLHERAAAPDAPTYALALNNLGLAMLETEAPERAIDALEQSLAMYERLDGRDHPRTRVALHGLGHAWLSRARPELARPYLERALVIYEALDGDPVELGEVRFNLARALWASTDEHERSRARELVDAARLAFEAGGAVAVGRLEQLRAWELERAG